ncbi:MAG: hypothetical protein IAF94_25170 [Pirellulaceae bacterium]|nr:hypothetical protein [Pirellulaceae bacterium]
MYDAESYIKSAKHLARFVAVGKITPEEYASQLAQSSCLLSEFDSAFATNVLNEVPRTAFPALRLEVQNALRSDFQVPGPFIGGPGPGEAELARLKVLYTDRVRKWAAALATALAEM